MVDSLLPAEKSRYLEVNAYPVHIVDYSMSIPSIVLQSGDIALELEYFLEEIGLW
jgi:hypothetical protein